MSLTTSFIILASSSSPSPTSTSQAESTSMTGAPPADESKIPTTTSLLFGFLVSFLGLFVVFVAWGLASRYMIDRRRERIALESDLMEAGARKYPKPELWDVWAAPGQEKWEEMMPLSVEVRDTSTSSAPPPLDPSPRTPFTPAEHLLHMYHGFGRRGFSFASPSPRTVPPDVPQVSKIPKEEGPLELQVAVLVAMPSSTSRTRDDTYATNGKRASLEVQEHSQDMDETSDVAVGVATIPWDKERMDFG